MRITFITPTMGLGGGPRVIVIYAQALVRMGHTVRIISQPPKQTSERKKVASLITNPRRFDQQPLKSHLDGSGLDHFMIDRWRPITNDDVPDADIVIATWWETAEWVNAFGPNKGAKVYFIQHHEVFPYLPIERCEATYRMPLHKIVVARWLQQVMATRYNDRIVDIVTNSVDKSQFFAADRRKQITPTVGVLYTATPWKGLDVSLSALQLLRKTFPSLQIISFGNQQPSKKMPLPLDATFFYSPPQDKIRDIYAECDVWITASRSEGFNLPAMEAMACRTPVVSTRTGWPEEAIKPYVNGVLVDIDDRVGLAKGIHWVLSQSDDDWRSLSLNAYATVATSSWQASAEMFERALKHACRRSARGEISGKCTAYFPNGNDTSDQQ